MAPMKTEDLVLTIHIGPDEAFRDAADLQRHKAEGWRVESAFLHQATAPGARRLCTVRLSRDLPE